MKASPDTKTIRVCSMHNEFVQTATHVDEDAFHPIASLWNFLLAMVESDGMDWIEIAERQPIDR